MIEGILNNEDSGNQSSLLIRDLVCSDDEMKKEKDAFLNKEESEDIELEILKEITQNKLPQANRFQLTVMIRKLISLFSF